MGLRVSVVIFGGEIDWECIRTCGIANAML